MSAPHPLIAELRTLRTERGLSINALSRALGYAAPTIQSWEAGRTVPNLDVLTDYATVMGVRVVLEPAAERTAA
ncbi:helix-turn-helix domain-containing protein [Nocardiopsis sp. NPDC057823]|uniref:helix-turn-helix domain-containing protein n=1 Tax=Nocardiopsis sp. NPDC057823 TaxID=3346256 RepID=UPI00366C5CA4